MAETTAAYLTGEPGAPQRELREWDEENYVERPRPLSLGQVQALPVPGHVGVGEHELELHPADGHTADGMAAVGAVGARARLRRLPVARRDPGALRERVARRLPGHAGAPAPAGRAGRVGGARATARAIEGARAAAILDEDVRYLTDWELPLTRRTAAQRAVDAENRERAGEAP